MVQRIPLKNSLFTHPQLAERVQKWVDSLDMTRFMAKQNFKYFPFFVNSLPPSFLQAALLYSIQKRLVGLVKEGQVDLLQLNRLLKESYLQLNMTLLQKKDSYFYFLCVYLTKLAASFLESTFSDLAVDLNLQAEMFIALVHVMLGVQVCPKAYQLNLKKIVKSNSTVRLFTVSKCDSIESFPPEKASQLKVNFLGPKRLLTKKTIDRKWTHDASCFEPVTAVEQFRSTLKENLAIQVLPRLPPKQMKAAQFDHLTELAEAAKEGDEKKYLFTTRENKLPKSPSDHLICTQNSSSFKLMLAKNKVPLRVFHREVKISHRPQLVAHKRASLTPAPNHLREEEEQSQEQVRVDNSRKDWSLIIKDLKQHVKINSKHTMSRNCLETAAETPEVGKGHSEREVQKKMEVKIEEGPRERKEEEQVKKEDQRKIRHFMYWINQQEGANGEGGKKESFPGSHQFRQLKKKFEGECLLRDEETNYSMFNLNSTFSFFRSLLH